MTKGSTIYQWELKLGLGLPASIGHMTGFDLCSVKFIPKQNLNAGNDFIETVSSFSDFQVLNVFMLIHLPLPTRPNPAPCFSAL